MLIKNTIAAMALLTVWSLPALANDGRPEREVRERVCVYEHENYGGYEQCFTGGEDISDLGLLRNRISSVRILGRGKIVLFERRNFQGREIVITADTPSLRSFGAWNDSASSVRVAGFGGGRGGRDDWREGRRDDDWRNDDRNDSRRDEYRDARRSFGEDRVCFYQHVNFRGDSECFDLRDELRELDSRGWNNRISSVRVFGRTRIQVFERKNYGGQSLLLEGDIADLHQVFSPDRAHWDDRISSFRISGGGGRR